MMEQEEENQPDLSLVYNQLNKKDLAFRPKKLPIVKDLNTKACDICCVGFDRKNQSTERGLTVISCYGCTLTCHLYCYGLNTEIELNDHQNNQGYFVCDRCIFNQKVDQPCVVCNNKTGLKKQLETQSDTHEFVHPICAMTSKSIEVVSFIDLKFRRTKTTKDNLICCYCNHKGANIRCDNISCDKHAHIYCIMKAIYDIGGYLNTYCENSDRTKVWDMLYNYKQLFNPGYLSGSFKDIKAQVKTQAKQILKQFGQIQQHNVELDVDQIFDQYSQIDKIEEEKQSIVHYYCNEHKVEELFCSCQSNNQTDEMIQCDQCSEWYHSTCLMTPDEFVEVATQDNYNCPFCSEWNKLKMINILKFKPINRINEILPKYMKITLPTLICLGIYCERSLQYLQKQYNEQYSNAIESLLSNLPVHQPLTKLISQIKEKSHIAEFMNYLLKCNQYKSDTWVVKTQMNSDGTGIPENITHNNKLKLKLKKVTTLFKDYDELQFYDALEQQLQSVQHAYECITKKSKITKEELKQFTGEQFNEFKWFQNQKQAYKEWKLKLIGQFKQAKNQFNEFSEDLDQSDDPIESLQEILNQMGELKSIEDYYKLIMETKLWLNKAKVHDKELLTYLQQGRQFIFAVPWIDLVIQEIENGQAIIQQGQGLAQTHDDLEDIRDYLEQTERLVLYYVENKELYTYEARMNAFEEYMSELHQLQNDDSDSEIVTSPTQGTKISLEHLQMMIGLGQELKIQQKYLDQIHKKIEKLEVFRQKIIGMIQTKQLSDQLKKKFASELLLNEQFNIPEILVLQKRLEVFQEVEKVRVGKLQTFESMRSSLQKAITFEFEDKIINYFETELSKAEQLQIRAQNLLKQVTFEPEHLDEAKELVQLIGQCKVQIEEKELLQSLQKAVVLVDNLYDFYMKHKSPDQEMEIEQDKKLDLDFKLNQIQDPQHILFIESPQLISDLELIISKNIILIDERIRALRQQFAELLWDKQSQYLLSLWKDDKELPLTLIEQVLQSNDDTIVEFRTIYQQEYQQLSLLLSQLGIILTQPNGFIVVAWLNTHSTMQLKIKGGQWDQLKVASVWVTIVQKYIMLMEVPSCTYESLKLLSEIMHLSHMPKTSYVSILTFQKIQQFTMYIDRVREFNFKREQFLEKQAAIKKSDQSKLKLQFTLREAQALDQQLTLCKINHEFITSEFYEEYKSVIEIREQLISMSDDNMVTYKQLYQRASQLFILDQEIIDQMKIKIYYHKIKQIIDGTQQVELPKAKKLYGMLSQLYKTHNQQDDGLLTQFEQCLSKADSIQSLINKIQEHQSYTYEEIEQAQAQLESIQMQITLDNLFHIEHIYSECISCRSLIVEIQESKIKAKETTVVHLLDRLQQLPLPHERKLIHTWIEDFICLKNQYNLLRSTISKQKQNPNGKELVQMMTNFKNDYNLSIVIYPDAEHFLSEYNEFCRKLESIEQNIDHEYSFSEFNDLLSLFRWGEQYERVKITLWVKQVTAFRDNKSQWGVTQLRNFLNQGYEILDQMLTYGPKATIDKIKAPILYLEQLIQKVLDYVMSSIDYTVAKFVDNKIDTYELTSELQHLTNSEKVERIREFQPKKPFDDLAAYQDRKSKIQSQRIKQKVMNQLSAPQNELDIVQKKVKHNHNPDKATVNQQLREQKKKDLLQILLINPIFSKKDPSYLEVKVKELENQEFGEHHKSKQRYNDRLNTLIGMFKELKSYECLSKKLLYKQFNSEAVNFILKKYEINKMAKCEEELRQKQQQKQGSNYNPLAVKSQLKLQQVTSISANPKQEEEAKQKKVKQDDFLSQIINDTVAQPQINKQPIQQTQLIQKQQQVPQSLLPIHQVQQFQQVSVPKQHSGNRSPSPSSRSKSSYDKRRSDSSSSDLPELQVDNDKPILYNPDAQDEPIPKAHAKQELKEIQFGDVIYRIGKRYKLCHLDKPMNCELYSLMPEQKLKEVPRINNELKHLKPQQVDQVISAIEKLSQKSSSSILAGWIFPEKYSEIGEYNKFAEQLRKDKQTLGQSQQEHSIIINIFHIEQLANSVLFKGFQPQEVVSESQFSRKENGIWKFWMNSCSKLCFVIQIKTTQICALSSFVPVSLEKIKNIIKAKDVVKWVDQKISEHKKSKQAAPKPELEPVTSDDEIGEKDYQLLDGLKDNEEIMQQLFSGELGQQFGQL